MRTNEEIVARIKEVAGNDWLGTERTDLITRLPFEAAKVFLKTDATAENWAVSPRDKDFVVAEMLEYMPFAWDKANGGRGISAGRSMSHFSAWLWLVGVDLGDLTDYQYYGKDNLVAICKHFGWDHTQWDDGERVN